MVYAFDYDKTLTDELLQRLVVKLRRQQEEVWVVTMRSDNDYNNDVMKDILAKLRLTKHNIVFCAGKPKWEFLKGINADIYVDNITDEFEVIKNHTNTIPLLWV